MLTKSHALGNDYLVADPSELSFAVTPERVRLLRDALALWHGESQSRWRSTDESPLPRSAAAATRTSGDGSSPATTGIRRRTHAVPGPGIWKPPSTNG